MDKAQKNYFAGLLKKERRRISSLLRAYDRGLRVSERDSTEELSSYDNHPADLGSETFARGLDIAIRDRLNETKTRIDKAQEKLKAGTYGICEVCGKEIEEERLRAVPYTEVCAGCKGVLDENRSTRERPAEEDLASTPFDRTFLDEDDSVIYDGEDTWQAVEVYGSSTTPAEMDEAVDYEQPFEDAREPRGYVEDVEELAATDNNRNKFVVRRKRKT